MKPLGPAYLVHGSDRPKVDQALRRLRDRIEAAGGSVERLQAGDGGDETTAAPAGVVLECNALGLLGGPRLVLVSGIEAWKAEQSLAVLVEYLAAPAPDATLALVASDALDAKHPLVTGRLAGLELLLYNLPERRGLPEWIAQGGAGVRRVDRPRRRGAPARARRRRCAVAVQRDREARRLRAVAASSVARTSTRSRCSSAMCHRGI